MNIFLFFIFFSEVIYANNSGASESLLSFLIFPFLFILMYFLIIRPQTKKVNEHKKLLDELKINDEIFTQGGIVGKIKKICDQFVVLSITDNTDILIKKDSVSGILPKGTIKQLK